MATLSLAQFFITSAAQARAEASISELEKHQSNTGHRFRRALAKVQPLIKRYGYWAAAGATLIEGMGIPVPGQSQMNIALLLLLVTTAAILGNSFGYMIGRWGGRIVLNKLRVNPQRQEHLDNLFRRWGGLVIMLARFVDGLRQLNGIISGMLKMPWWTFTAYNVAGALLWTSVWGLGTYYLGRDIHFIAGFFHRHRQFLLILSLTTLVASLGYLLSSRIRR